MSVPSLLSVLDAAPSGSGLLPFALLLTAKATLLLGAGALLAGALRRAPAAARHLVWCCTVAAILLLPVLSLLLPGWRVAVWVPASVTPAATAERLRTLPPFGEVGLADAAAAARASTETPEAALASTPASGSRAAEGVRRSPAGWAALAWMLGALAVLARMLIGQWGLLRLRRRAGPVDPASRWLAREMAGSLGMRRPVETLCSRSATMPMTWGVLRPTILLPAESAGWPMERRRAVLLHELAHIKRLDCLTQTLALLCCALYWFHPGVWWAARRMRVERETACDDAVLGAGVRPSEYAMQLLEVARSYRGGGILQAAAVAMARPSQLEGRMLAVLDAARNRAAPSRRGSALALCAAGVVLLPVAALRPTAGAADTIPQPAWAPSAPMRPLAAPDAPLVTMEPDAVLPASPVHGTSSVLVPAAAPHPSSAPHPMPAARPFPAVDPRPGAAPRPVHAPRRAESDPRIVAALIEALRDSDAGVRSAAARGLGEAQAPEAVPPLVAALRDVDAGVRKSAAWALGEIGDRRAVDGLVAALRDGDAEVRRTAAWALGEIRDPRAADAIGAALRDASAEVRRMAAWALSELDDPAAVPALVAALRDGSAEVRAMAAHALGEIGDRRAVDPLLGLLDDADARVQRMAVGALAELRDVRAAAPLAAALAGAPPQASRTIIHALSEMGLTSAPQPLLDALGAANAEVRRAAAHALAEIRDPRAIPALRRALADPDAAVRRAAMQALAEMEDPAALDALIEALKDADAAVRRGAAAAIGARG